MPTRTRSLREDQKQFTRRKLIESAKELFESRGYAQTSAEDIAAEAGASRATFYLHFQSKADLLSIVFEAEHVAPVLQLIGKFGTLDSLTERDVRAWIGEYADLYNETRSVMRAWMQGESREGTLRPVYDRVLDAVLDTLGDRIVAVAGGRGSKAMKRSEARVRALLMFSELERFCYYQFIRQMDIPRERGLDLVASSWHGLITAA